MRDGDSARETREAAKVDLVRFIVPPANRSRQRTIDLESRRASLELRNHLLRPRLLALLVRQRSLQLSLKLLPLLPQLLHPIKVNHLALLATIRCRNRRFRTLLLLRDLSFEAGDFFAEELALFFRFVLLVVEQPQKVNEGRVRQACADGRPVASICEEVRDVVLRKAQVAEQFVIAADRRPVPVRRR